MNTPWRMIGYCGTMVVLLGIGRAWGQAHAAPEPPLVEMLLPPDVDKNTHVVSESLSTDVRTGVSQTQGNVSISLPNGVQLRIQGAPVSFPRVGPDRVQHVLITLPVPPAKP
jgi:hypothetical protein